MTDFKEFHSPAMGDIFSTAGARCGATAATEPNKMLRVISVDSEVTCVECRRILLGGTDE